MSFTIKPKNVSVKQLIKGYHDDSAGDGEEYSAGNAGVVGYDGKLNIRPSFQRNFVYGDKDRNAVIETISKQCPLNAMYWAKSKYGGYEVLDGQQRTISICRFCEGKFSMKLFGEDMTSYFANLTDSQQKIILDYPLMIYVCDGDEIEMQKWFKTINTRGAKLEDQEVRNAVYSSKWASSARRFFSRTDGMNNATFIAKKYLTGKANRQKFLETAIKWHCKSNLSEDIDSYMAKHKQLQSQNAEILIDYFKKIIDWVEKVFPEYHIEMKGVDWGELYNEFKDRDDIDIDNLNARINTLLTDDRVSNRSGIFSYVLSGDRTKLNIRTFPDKTRQLAYNNQNGLCVFCKTKFPYSVMESDHVISWSEGGETDTNNCQMLCQKCHQEKSAYLKRQSK